MPERVLRGAQHLLRDGPFDLRQHAALQGVRHVLHLLGDAAAESGEDVLPVVLAGRGDRRVESGGRAGFELCRRQEELGDPVGVEEGGRRHRPAEEHVVVEIDEVLGQSGDQVQPGLDRVRVEGGQRAGAAEQFAMADHGEPRVRVVQPRRELVVGDHVDPPDPGGERDDRAQRVLELVAAGEPGLVGGDRVDLLRPDRGQGRVLAFEPVRVVAVDPGEDRVDGEADVVGRVVGELGPGAVAGFVAGRRHHPVDRRGADPDDRALGRQRGGDPVPARADQHRRRAVLARHLVPELDLAGRTAAQDGGAARIGQREEDLRAGGRPAGPEPGLGDSSDSDLRPGQLGGRPERVHRARPIPAVHGDHAVRVVDRADAEVVDARPVEHGGHRVEVLLPGPRRGHLGHDPGPQGTSPVPYPDQRARLGRPGQRPLPGELPDQPQLPVRRQQLDQPQPIAFGK
ncbi:hypothetical protein Ato02nite_036670 [Paractinoplanes toevensis]|uniref:Uncharacterized protein n=1 Tax=Paractinoplanes toevensis TaxID=571911 RepID=A0A919TCX7_9ACTN|nr:hypothetical protein Ato02nite_036670 [Actinoplanes toevensis]